MKITKQTVKGLILDILYAMLAGAIIGSAYHIFQNSNGFAPGGVGGLATITNQLIGGSDNVWTVLMLAFNLPIFTLVCIFINRKLGGILIVYMLTQSLMPQFWSAVGAHPYTLANSGEDFNLLFAVIATGVICGFASSLMLKRFGASGGTYAISALLKHARPAMNVAYVAFILDASVVAIAFFLHGMRLTPVMCTLLNLFIASMIVDRSLAGLKDGYKFEIITTDPDALSQELITKLHHGVTEIRAHGMYSDTDRFLIICIINKRQIGTMIKILKGHPDTFATFEKTNEVFGNFKRKV